MGKEKARLILHNELERDVHLWLEPYCSGADVPAKHQILLDVELQEYKGRDEVELVLSEQSDGKLVLTLWADDDHALAFGEVTAEPAR